jgi:hypothetical protein
MVSSVGFARHCALKPLNFAAAAPISREIAAKKLQNVSE